VFNSFQQVLIEFPQQSKVIIAHKTWRHGSDNIAHAMNDVRACHYFHIQPRYNQQQIVSEQKQTQPTAQ